MSSTPNAPILGMRAPRAVLSVIDAEASRLTMTRSALVRELLTDALRARGLWPPAKVAA